MDKNSEYELELKMCIRDRGMPEDAALRSITINAARIAGIDDRVGSLEPGKDADIAVFSGHPLDVRSRCVMCMVSGVVAHSEL